MEFVDEWFIEQTLGEGAFGEVKLLVNKKTKDEVALKIVNLQQHPDAADTVRKEIQIHKILDHENIIRFYGSRKEGPIEYLFLEYASGGELFDRIEPDVGVLDTTKSHLWFKQLLNGVEYLHTRGVAHRDLKPENILLDATDNVKITDFGLATVFRIRGTERLLEKRCGTLPYVAPEVLKGQYKAMPADIWSCGIILVALLAGELPWDKATQDCGEYARWKDGETTGIPWSKLDFKDLMFIRRLLSPAAGKRITMSQINSHQWMSQKTVSRSTAKQGTGSHMAKKIASGLNLGDDNDTPKDDSITRLCLSQPGPWGMGEASESQDCNRTPAAEQRHLNFSFSQPAPGNIDDFFLNSQLGDSLSTQSPPISRFVKRMTRFCVTTPVDTTIKELTGVLESLGYTFKTQRTGLPCVTVSTVDRRKNVLTFKSHVVEMGNKMVLLDFRLSRGDGLEFKRSFIRIQEQLAKIEWKGPMGWVL